MYFFETEGIWIKIEIVKNARLHMYKENIQCSKNMMSMLEPITYKVRSFQSFDENCFTKYVDISSEEYL